LSFRAPLGERYYMSYVSHADLGGQPDAGAIQPEPHYQPFHAAWESRALALTLAMGATGAWNLDMARSARETLDSYRSLTYFEIWLAGLEKLLTQRGLLSADELARGRMLDAPLPVARILSAGDVPTVLARGAPTVRVTDRAARFRVGDQVRARAARVQHHTRLPGYVVGKLGRIERLHGAHVFADTHAQGLGEQPEWLYTVVFDATELWGAGAEEGLQVSVDAWEPYLEDA
jgi:nitrile hydratase beta subunit